MDNLVAPNEPTKVKMVNMRTEFSEHDQMTTLDDAKKVAKTYQISIHFLSLLSNTYQGAVLSPCGVKKRQYKGTQLQWSFMGVQLFNLSNSLGNIS